MQNKTIGFFNTVKAWGGGEKWHFEMAKRLATKGYRVVVFANKGSELHQRLTGSSIPCFAVSVGNLSFLNPLKIKAIAKKIQSQKIDILIMNNPADVKTAGLAARSAGVRHIIYRRGSAIPVKNSLLNRYLFRNIITGIIANSKETLETILQNNINLFDRKKIRVIYNGIDIEAFDKLRPTEIPLHNDDKIVIGNLGRLVKQKGQKYLIEITQILKEQNINFSILIGGSGELENELKTKVLETSTENEIIFAGFVENAHDFMSKIDIFVLPSLWEGFGYVIVEAMAAGLPVVAFNISSNPEIIADGETGFLVPMGDTEALAQKIEILMNNSVLRQSMGENARKRAVEKFSIERTVKELENYLNEL